MSKMKIIHLGPKIEGLAELIENDFEILTFHWKLLISQSVKKKEVAR